MRIKTLLLLLWSTCNVLTAIGQIKFNHIGTQQGLSQSTAFNIFQDSRGFLWFATSDGLNKYDGYRFTVYRHEFDKPNSISSSNISCITEDFEGNLWIGTINGGVNKLEVKTGKFIRYDSDKYHANIGNRSISGIIATRDHKIWAATYGYGLLTFVPSPQIYIDFCFYACIVTGKQIGRASCRERVCLYV